MSIIHCPKCRDLAESKVTCSRAQEIGDFSVVLRYRKCTRNHNFRTYEIASTQLEAYAIQLLESRMKADYERVKESKAEQLRAVAGNATDRHATDVLEGYHREGHPNLPRLPGDGVDEHSLSDVRRDRGPGEV